MRGREVAQIVGKGMQALSFVQSVHMMVMLLKENPASEQMDTLRVVQEGCLRLGHSGLQLFPGLADQAHHTLNAAVQENLQDHWLQEYTWEPG